MQSYNEGSCNLYKSIQIFNIFYSSHEFCFIVVFLVKFSSNTYNKLFNGKFHCDNFETTPI